MNKSTLEQDIACLENVLKMFSSDEQGEYMHNNFYALRVAIAMNRGNLDKSIVQSLAYIIDIIDGIWNIFTLIERLQWCKQESTSNEHIYKMWMIYAAIDIKHFHTEYRSIMDYVAMVIDCFSPNGRGKLPNSFERLCNQKDKYFKSGALHNDVINLLNRTHWHSEIRDVRDDLVHKGSKPFVLPATDKGILFQITNRRLMNKFNKPNIMFNDNVVYFERYASIYFSYMIDFLDSLATVLSKINNIELNAKGLKTYSSGHEVLKQWNQNVLAMLKSNFQENKLIATEKA